MIHGNTIRRNLKLLHRINATDEEVVKAIAEIALDPGSNIKIKELVKIYKELK